MEVILLVLCIIGVFYIVLFYMRKNTNYSEIINDLDTKLEQTKKQIEQNNQTIKELNKQISKYK